MKQTVLIIGGGVAGLTAAHELVLRGYRVTIIELHKMVEEKLKVYQKTGVNRDRVNGDKSNKNLDRQMGIW